MVYVNTIEDIDRRTPLLLPPDLRDGLPEDHVVHFIVEAIEVLGREPHEPDPPAEASTKERMAHRMRSAEGRQKYRLRKQTVEPVFALSNR